MHYGRLVCCHQLYGRVADLNRLLLRGSTIPTTLLLYWAPSQCFRNRCNLQVSAWPTRRSACKLVSTISHSPTILETKMSYISWRSNLTSLDRNDDVADMPVGDQDCRLGMLDSLARLFLPSSARLYSYVHLRGI